MKLLPKSGEREIMERPEQCRKWTVSMDLWMTVAAIALATLMIVIATEAQGQTFTVLHTFTGPDGSGPIAVPTLDRAGNLYGPTYSGTGAAANGTIFKFSHRGSGWVLSSLYDFQGGSDGAGPRAGLTLDQSGAIYGSTELGGGGNCTPSGCGTVFKLRPPASFCHSVSCSWEKTLLYAFDNRADGAQPDSPVIFDHAGNIYGTTGSGGGGLGVAYQLTPSGGSWTENIMQIFTNDPNGAYPNGLISDSSGNFYGTTEEDGPYGFGTVFELSPSAAGWTLTNLYAFHGTEDGGFPIGRLVFDQSGNLYGTTFFGGPGDDSGTVFELSPQGGGSWTYNVLAAFQGEYSQPGTLVFDAAGNLYGVTYAAGTAGSVFKVTRSGSSWTLTTLYYFTGGSDGGGPIDTVAIDSNGNLYGVAYYGGGGYCTYGCGTIWEITP